MKFEVLALLSVVMFFSPSIWAGGTISGVVMYQGIPPELKKRPVTIDSEICGKEAVVEDLLVSKKGGVRNAVVYLRGPVSGAKQFVPPEGGFVIDQKGCRFEPHVRIVAAGSNLDVLNSDQILHNFHTYSRTNPPLNKTQPRTLPKLTLVFDRPEIFEVRCDIHDWMRGWLVVTEHPYYAVTDEEGGFQLTDVPAGDYTLSLWHESLGTKSKRIQVREGEETRLEFKLAQHP